MSEIKCPKCGEVFKVDEQGYSAILEQVRSAEFSRELNERVAEERQNVQKVAELQFAGRLTEKDREIDKLKAEANAKLAADKESLNARIAEQERQIAELKAMLKNGDTARALAVKPKVLICDEATSALDVTVQKEILELLNELRCEQGTALSILFICHDISLVQQFCDRVLVMYHGDIVEQGSPDEVICHPQDEYTKRLIDSVL